MIRLEVKVLIPDDKTRKDFLKLFLDSASADKNSFFWQIPFDIVDGERATLEAVLGAKGFPFLQGTKMMQITCDLLNKNQAKKAFDFFKSLAINWEIEINCLVGKRMYNDILDLRET